MRTAAAHAPVPRSQQLKQAAAAAAAGLPAASVPAPRQSSTSSTTRESGSSRRGGHTSPIDYGKYKTKMCRNFMQGLPCRYDGRCAFAHGEDQLSRPGQTPSAPSSQQTAQQSSQSTATMHQQPQGSPTSVNVSLTVDDYPIPQSTTSVATQREFPTTTYTAAPQPMEPMMAQPPMQPYSTARRNSTMQQQQQQPYMGSSSMAPTPANGSDDELPCPPTYEEFVAAAPPMMSTGFEACASPMTDSAPMSPMVSTLRFRHEPYAFGGYVYTNRGCSA